MTTAPAIVVIGAGGHAKVLLDTLLDRGLAVMGLLDSNASLHGTKVLGFSVLGDDSWLESDCSNQIRLVNGIGSNGVVTAKRHAFERAKNSGHAFAEVIHPTAVIGREVARGEGTQILARAVVEPGCVLGANTTINTGAIVNHDCRIGSHVHVAPGAVILGSATVGEATHIGAGAIILPGLNVGRTCIVAAGAVVIADVADGTTVSGVPAKPIERATP